MTLFALFWFFLLFSSYGACDDKSFIVWSDDLDDPNDNEWTILGSINDSVHFSNKCPASNDCWKIESLSSMEISISTDKYLNFTLKFGISIIDELLLQSPTQNNTMNDNNYCDIYYRINTKDTNRATSNWIILNSYSFDITNNFNNKLPLQIYPLPLSINNEYYESIDIRFANIANDSEGHISSCYIDEISLIAGYHYEEPEAFIFDMIYIVIGAIVIVLCIFTCIIWLYFHIVRVGRRNVELENIQNLKLKTVKTTSSLRWSSAQTPKTPTTMTGITPNGTMTGIPTPLSPESHTQLTSYPRPSQQPSTVNEALNETVTKSSEDVNLLDQCAAPSNSSDSKQRKISTQTDITDKSDKMDKVTINENDIDNDNNNNNNNNNTDDRIIIEIESNKDNKNNTNIENTPSLQLPVSKTGIATNKSVSAVSTTTHRLNDIMFQVLNENKTPTVGRDPHEIGNILAPPSKSVTQIQHQHPYIHTEDSTDNGVDTDHLESKLEYKRNDSVPITHNHMKLMFNNTKKKSRTSSSGIESGNIRDIENIIIPRMDLDIGQSMKSPGIHNKDTSTDITTTTTTGTGTGITTITGTGTECGKLTATHTRDSGLSTRTTTGNKGQLTPTIGSRFSAATGVTAFIPDGTGNAALQRENSRDVPIQLTPYDLDEDDDKKTISYDHGKITPTPNTRTSNNYESAIKNIIDGHHIAIDFNAMSTDGYNTVHKGIRMELQDSNSYQSSILPLPDDISTNRGIGKEQNEHDSLSFADHESMIHALKNRYPTKTPQTMPTHFSEEISDGNTFDIPPPLIEEKTVETLDPINHAITSIFENKSNSEYLYDDKQLQQKRISKITQREEEESLDFGSVATSNNTNNNIINDTSLRNINSIIPYSDNESIYSPSSVLNKVSSTKPVIHQNQSIVENDAISHQIPKFQDNKARKSKSKSNEEISFNTINIEESQRL